MVVVVMIVVIAFSVLVGLFNLRITVFAATMNLIIRLISCFRSRGVVPNLVYQFVQLCLIQLFRVVCDGNLVVLQTLVGNFYAFHIKRIFNTLFAHVANTAYPKRYGLNFLSIQDHCT